jgi:broad specificity phosphatase PhoE
MSRALETAQLIAKEINYDPSQILIVPELHERMLGDIEGKTYAEVPNHGNFEDLEETPHIEPLEALHIRLQKAFQSIADQPEKQILVVGHNGSGRMLMAVARQLQPEAMHEQPRLENAVIYPLH